MARRRTLLVLLALALIIVVAGCRGRLNTIAPTATVTGQATVQAVVPTTQAPSTETPTRRPPTRTLTPSTTPSATATITPTFTPSLTFTPTDTPLPTDTPSPSPDFTKTALYVYLITLAASSPTADSTLTAVAQQIEQTQISSYLAETLTAQPTDTPTITPTLRPSGTPIAVISSTPNLTQTARVSTQVAAFVAETLAAQPTDTLIPSSTPFPTDTSTITPSVTPSFTPSLTVTSRPSSTPIAIISSTPNLTATTRYEAQVEAAVLGTLAGIDTSTPYPTFTPVPTDTPPPTITASPSLPPTYTSSPIIVPSPDTAETAQAATLVSAYVAGTLEALPTETADIPNTATIHAQETQLAEYLQGTLTALPSPIPLPSLTPVPTLPPILTLTPTEPPLDLPATATAIVAAATATAEAMPEISPNQMTSTAVIRTNTAIVGEYNATMTAIGAAGGVQATPTYTQNQLTATAIIMWATMTAGGPTATIYATFQPTIVPTSPYSTQELTQTAEATAITATAYAELLPTPLPPGDLTATATYYISPTPSATIPETMVTLPPTVYATSTPTIIGIGGTATAIVASATAAASGPASGRFEDQAFGIAFDVPEGWSPPVRSDNNQLYLTDDRAQIFIYRGDDRYFAGRWGIPADEIDLEDAARAIAEKLGGIVGSTEIDDTALIGIEGDDFQGAIYLRALPNGDWLIISVNAPIDDFAAYQEAVFDPLAARLKASAWTLSTSGTAAIPAATPTFTPTPSFMYSATALPLFTPTFTPTAYPISPTPIVFEPYTSDYLGLSFDIPAGWIPWQAEDLEDPMLGLQVEVYYSSEADIGSIDTVSSEAIALMRLDLASIGIDYEAFTPKELLSMMEVAPDIEITPYTIAGQQGARGFTEESALVVYAAEIEPGQWLMALLMAPPHQSLLLLDETIMQPVVNSITIASEEIEITPTLTAFPTYEQPEVTFEPYSSDYLGLAFDRPSGWDERGDEAAVTAGRGIRSVAFVANPNDDLLSNEILTGPVIQVQRFNLEELGLSTSYESPRDFLDKVLDINPIFVQPYPDLSYPAARALLDAQSSMVYALQLSENDWILAWLSVPPGADLLALDEMIMQPVVNSIQVPEVSERTATPTALPTFTVTSSSTPLHTLTYTPTSSATPTASKPIVDPSATAIPLTVTSEPAAFEPYVNGSLGLAFDIPADWTLRVFSPEQINILEVAGDSVLIYSDPADIDEDFPPPTAPTIAIFRSSAQYSSISEALIDFAELDEAFIQPYSNAQFPAIRGLQAGDTDDLHAMVYMLQLGENDWIFAMIVAPREENILLLDETIMQPVVNSIQLLEPSNHTPTPSAIPSATATATSSIRPTATYTPTNFPSPTGTLGTPTPTYTPT